ncbi:ABC transporter substrate-binding protein [Arthrobacter sp. AL08]|uniref:ABC transporter substrate-binding protein n=1 Tax=unclassified Arthrobacter TaxID=235627 RepID=UPI00249A2377|nr:MULTISPECIES: ABC transporter substrate-binding protein [unclassified Arthrobacter]MDI3240841.1 ABC transporter substrate-binding protein [Arthrobacter sp. AL05]MDI3277183.1 ABC transporter substrate-binding protein [Arthrobacter sp. AL08]
MNMMKPLARTVALAAGTLLALSLAACGAGNDPLNNDRPSGSSTPGAALVIGSANFPESETLAEVYAGALNAAGIPASTKPGIGSREVYVRALQDRSIDVVPDYSGNLLRYVDKTATAASADEVMKALPGKLPDELTVLEAAQAEDKDSIVVTEATAAKFGLKTLADLGKVCDQIALGMPPEAKERPQGLPGLKANYGCEPKEFVPFSDGGGPVTVRALLDDRIQAADVFSTSPLILQNKLVSLADPLNNFAAQQVVPLALKDRLDAKSTEVLNKVSRVLTTADLLKLNEEVSGDRKVNPRDAAAAWLKDKGFTG